MSASLESQNKSLPPPWDRIFSLGTRAFVWVLLVAILYILRPFFLLIFLTFVFAYIQAHAVEGLGHRILSRPLRVTIVGLVFLGTIFATGYTMFPQIQREAVNFGQKAPEYMEQADIELEKAMRESPWLARLLGREDLIPAAGEQDKEGGGNGDGADGNPKPMVEGPGSTEPRSQPGTAHQPPAGRNGRPGGKQGPVYGPPEKPAEHKMVRNFVFQLIGISTGADMSRDPERTMRDNLRKATDYFTQVLGVASAFLLSLLFSFLIVLDLPKLRRAIAGLEHTKVGFIYDEVADNIHTFGKVLGRALEAQFFIAVVNTILTGIGIYFMGLPNLVFLCTVVFLCSFIPVAGVFLSSAPICLMALQTSGFGLMLIAIGLILLIHTIEAYILNPKIFGHHLRMTPVLVLIVLTVGGKLFGVWGLVLGLPIVNYFFRHAIRREPPTDAAMA
jgi:predicted PurR-regulated permease PerM